MNIKHGTLGRPRPNGTRRKPRFPIFKGTEFSTNCSESWNSVSILTVVSKHSLWHLLIQLKTEDSSVRTKMMAVRTEAWKDRNPGRTARREAKKDEMAWGD